MTFSFQWYQFYCCGFSSLGEDVTKNLNDLDIQGVKNKCPVENGYNFFAIDLISVNFLNS